MRARVYVCVCVRVFYRLTMGRLYHAIQAMRWQMFAPSERFLLHHVFIVFLSVGQ